MSREQEFECLADWVCPPPDDSNIRTEVKINPDGTKTIFRGQFLHDVRHGEGEISINNSNPLPAWHWRGKWVTVHHFTFKNKIAKHDRKIKEQKLIT